MCLRQNLGRLRALDVMMWNPNRRLDGTRDLSGRTGTRRPQLLDHHSATEPPQLAPWGRGGAVARELLRGGRKIGARVRSATTSDSASWNAAAVRPNPARA